MASNAVLQNIPFIISIADGKGGTGKSFVSSNMAIQFAQSGLKTILVDQYLGAASLHSLLNTDKPKERTFSESHNKLDNFIMEEGIANLLLIPGNSFGLDFTHFTASHKTKFFNQIREISAADVVLIDLDGGTKEQTLDIFLMGHAGIIITTPDQETVIKTYEFLKSAVYRIALRICNGKPDIENLVQSFLHHTSPKQSITIQELSVQIAKVNPWIAHMLLKVCEDLDFYIIVNKSKNIHDIQTIQQLHETCQKFLHIDLNFPGLLMQSSEVRGEATTPLAILHPESTSCKTIKQMGAFILDSVAEKIFHDNQKSHFEEQLQKATELAHTGGATDKTPENKPN